MKDSVILIGYSGHAFTVCEALLSQQIAIGGYYDLEKKADNPYHLTYLGFEEDAIESDGLLMHQYIISIGNNDVRAQKFVSLNNYGVDFVNAVHRSAIIATTAQLGRSILISTGAIINAKALLADGVICNTGCIVEHGCQIQDFAHIAPGAILCGDVSVGARSFVGAASVIKEGVRIGDDVIIGAGTVVIRDVPDGCTIVGNPGKILSR